MTLLYLTVPDADFSAAPAAFLPGMDLHAPYAAYLLGTGYGGASDQLTDWSGNNRTLTASGSPAPTATAMTAAYANHYIAPFSETTLMAGAGATICAIARGGLTGSQQIAGNIAATGDYMSLSIDSGGMAANLKGSAGLKQALRAGDSGKVGLWHFYAGRYATNALDLFVGRTDLGSTVKVSATAFSGQSVTDASNLKIGGSELSSWLGSPDIAAVVIFNKLLSDGEVDDIRDMLTGLLTLYGIDV